MTDAKDKPDKPEPGRVVKRWVAECDYKGCKWAERDKPELHEDPGAAVREARTHAIEAGHIGAREVQVRRKYSPRVVQSEEIVE